MKKLTLFLSAMLLACATTLRAEGENTSLGTLFHETFGDNSSSARDWKDSYSVKSGVAAVYQNAKYSITNAKQGKNSTGQTKSGLNQSTQNQDAIFIVGPLSVAGYQNLEVTYYWKAGSIKGTYTTNLYYSTDGTNYTEVTRTSGKGATSFVQCVYSLPEAAQSNNLYLKVVFNTSNTQAIIDEFVLMGESASTATLQSIEITGEPTKKDYMAGEAFSTDGLKVMGNYDDDTKKEITEGIKWTVTPATLTAGTTSVEVKATVGEKTATRTIEGLTVTAPKTLTSIAVSGTPAEFWKGDTFNHNGMTVTAKWDDNSTTDVTTEATFSEPDMTTAGTQAITVTYKGKSTTYNITVKTIANTQETAYTVAEAIALIDAGKDLTTEVFVKGIVSKIVTPWSTQHNNITYNISDDGATTSTQFQLFRCVTNDANVGDVVIAKGVMTKYNSTYEFTSGNTIVAIVEKVVSSIAISGDAETTNYYAGQTFDPAGLVVTATFEDESTANVTELVDWTFDPAVLEEGTTTVSVSATYKELNAAPVVVTVTVGPAPKVVTIDLTKDETTTATADKLEWKGTILTITSARTSNNTAANNYYPGTKGQSYKSTRFYSGNTLTFTPVKGITLESITYTATTDNYATVMKNSTWTNATASVDGTTVTITPTDGEEAVSATIGGTTGGTSFVINYSGEASPTALDNAIVETPAVKSIENGQLIILRDGVKYNAMGVRLQ